MDLTKAEDIKKRWQDLHDPDNHDGVITHLEPDILKYEIKWVLQTKLVEVMELSYFKS